MPGPMGGPGPKSRGSAKPKNAKKTIARLIKYMGKYKVCLIVVFLAVLVSAGASVACDALIKPVLNNYIIPLFNRATGGETIVAKDFIPFAKLLGDRKSVV